MTCQAGPAASTVHAQQPSRPRSTIQTRRHSSPQSPSTVRPPGPITSHHRGPGPPPVPNANATQGPPPAPDDQPHDSESAKWIHTATPRCAIHKPQIMDTCCGILDKL
ncbi:unnamed protein product [Pleuronectes platessa]|uniref:Uncharacterized protein n=1 Tax=Pleuronectes platessa TaxID=8262 RepID=A0A9N7V559_PLEPL|nr:unnamed protein product [Pleuronectes platessa]